MWLSRLIPIERDLMRSMLHGRRQAFPAKNWLVASARSAQTAHRLHAYGRRACAPIRTATHSLACRPGPWCRPGRGTRGRALSRGLCGRHSSFSAPPPSCALCVTILKGPSRNFRKAGTCSGLPLFCCFSVTFFFFHCVAGSLCEYMVHLLYKWLNYYVPFGCGQYSCMRSDWDRDVLVSGVTYMTSAGTSFM